MQIHWHADYYDNFVDKLWLYVSWLLTKSQLPLDVAHLHGLDARHPSKKARIKLAEVGSPLNEDSRASRRGA
jgi:hypothetical protein